MNASGRINEIVDEALKRLGTPSRENLDAACERIRENMRSANPADMTPPPVLDARPVSLWGLRQPFLIAGGVVIAFAALTATTFWLSGRSPALGVSKVAVEPARSGSTPPVNQAESGAGLRSPSNEARTTAAPEIGAPASRARAIKRPEPKRAVEEAESPGQTVTGVGPTAPGAATLPEPVIGQPDGDPGRAVLDRVCTVCHGLRGIENYSYSSPDAYKDLVSDMILRGAVISDEETATIVEYLYKTYGQK